MFQSHLGPRLFWLILLLGVFSLESMKNLRIDPDRLWDSLMEMAKIGPGIAGGNNRQTLTDEDAEGRALFQKWCEDAGMKMGVDTMGNIFIFSF